MKRYTVLGAWLLLLNAVCGAEYPAEILDLSSWKLTLPKDTPRNGSPDEIRLPELKTFRDPESFFVNPQDAGIVFRASCGADTTKGSKYPRSELREMTGTDGEKNAAWGTKDGAVHTMTATLAVTHIPEVKQHVVCAQIHDAKDDLMMVRLEGRKLIIERNSSGDVELDSDYRLGDFFDLKIEAADGHVRVWYQNELKMDWEQSRSGCYFKIGCYTQSNRQKGDKPEAYGEVTVRRLQVRHTP